MYRALITISFYFLSFISFSQERATDAFLSDSSMLHASVSLTVKNAESGEKVYTVNSEKSLIPASVMKLITSAAALELLGPQYTFKTIIGYTGTLNKRSGRLEGNIIINGGGDPALGSEYFSDHYQDFLSRWTMEIKNMGIKKIDGRVITNDTYYDFQPVPQKWLWEDAGNYYGAGVYGLSVFDNTFKIHFKTSDDSACPVIIKIDPYEAGIEFSNQLASYGTSGKGYVFSAPYNTYGWFSGSVPSNTDDFVLEASITDPPLLTAKMLTTRLEAEKIPVSGDPATFRSEKKSQYEEIILIDEIISPPLEDIIEVLNHESVNLYAEHIIKELGKKFKNSGSTVAGAEVVKEFLQVRGINTDGMFIEDGSGLSPMDAINTEELCNLLIYMRNRGRYFPQYYSSLPDAGKEGTLKKYFRDPVFDLGLKLKSGSMTRVRSFAGYITTVSGKNMVFSIIINNYTGPSQNIIAGIEAIIKEIILYK